MPCPLIMDRRVDWKTTAESLIRQYGNQGRTLPTLLLLWRRWLLKHLVICPTVIVGNSEERTGPSDAGRASGVENITSNVLRRTTIAATGAQDPKYDVTGLT